MKKILFLCLFFSVIHSQGQEKSIAELDSVHIAFLNHLKKENLWEEGIHFLKSYPATNNSNYFNGIFNYHLERVDPSIFFLNQVKSNSIYWDQSRLLTSFQYAFKDSLLQSKAILNTYTPNSDLLKNLKNFQYAGISLLERNLDEFDSYSREFGSFYQLAPYEEVLERGRTSIEGLKSKSPFTTGFLSAIVPGAGRFYVGRPGEGVATLLVTGIFALQAREAYKKDGLRSPRFIIFGSLLSITYVSNIWGSVLSVKVANMEKNNQINEDILLNMHIPLRVIFD